MTAAVYDARVLGPAPLRDLLMHLALTDLFEARWTDAIHRRGTASNHDTVGIDAGKLDLWAVVRWADGHFERP